MASLLQSQANLNPHPIGTAMQSFLTATAHLVLFLIPCLLTTAIHIATSSPADTPELLG